MKKAVLIIAILCTALFAVACQTQQPAAGEAWSLQWEVPEKSQYSYPGSYKRAPEQEPTGTKSIAADTGSVKEPSTYYAYPGSYKRTQPPRTPQPPAQPPPQPPAPQQYCCKTGESYIGSKYMPGNPTYQQCLNTGTLEACKLCCYVNGQIIGVDTATSCAILQGSVVSCPYVNLATR